MTQPSMPLPATAAEPTSVPPAVLLTNHLKALKLPTFVREHEKVAMEAAQDQADYPRYLLRFRGWNMRSAPIRADVARRINCETLSHNFGSLCAIQF